MGLLKQVYKTEYAKVPRERGSLAASMLDQARRTRDDPVTRYVLLQEAAEVGASAGDVGTSWAAVELLVEFYEVDAVTARLDALTKLARLPASAATSASMVEAGCALANELQSSDDYDRAVRAATLADTAARLSKNTALMANAREALTEAGRLRQEYHLILGHRKTLQSKPEDMIANQAIGQFLCFSKGAWTGGLPYLAKGSDRVLQPLAAKEIAGVGRGEQEIELADGWWNAATKLPNGKAKSRIRKHACDLYLRAMPNVTGLRRGLAERRVMEFEAPGYRYVTGRYCHELKRVIPLSDETFADILTLEEKGSAIRIAGGRKNGDPMLIGGQEYRHFGKLFLLNATIASGKLDVAAPPKHTNYFILMRDRGSELTVQHLGALEVGRYTWSLRPDMGEVVLAVHKQEKEVSSIRLPAEQYREFGVGAMLPWPGYKLDITITFDK